MKIWGFDYIKTKWNSVSQTVSNAKAWVSNKVVEIIDWSSNKTAEKIDASLTANHPIPARVANKAGLTPKFAIGEIRAGLGYLLIEKSQNLIVGAKDATAGFLAVVLSFLKIRGRLGDEKLKKDYKRAASRDYRVFFKITGLSLWWVLIQTGISWIRWGAMLPQTIPELPQRILDWWNSNPENNLQVYEQDQQDQQNQADKGGWDYLFYLNFTVLLANTGFLLWYYGYKKKNLLSGMVNYLKEDTFNTMVINDRLACIEQDRKEIKDLVETLKKIEVSNKEKEEALTLEFSAEGIKKITESVKKIMASKIFTSLEAILKDSAVVYGTELLFLFDDLLSHFLKNRLLWSTAIVTFNFSPVSLFSAYMAYNYFNPPWKDTMLFPTAIRPHIRIFVWLLRARILGKDFGVSRLLSSGISNEHVKRIQGHRNFRFLGEGIAFLGAVELASSLFHYFLGINDYAIFAKPAKFVLMSYIYKLSLVAAYTQETELREKDWNEKGVNLADFYRPFTFDPVMDRIVKRYEKRLGVNHQGGLELEAGKENDDLKFDVEMLDIGDTKEYVEAIRSPHDQFFNELSPGENPSHSVLQTLQKRAVLAREQLAHFLRVAKEKEMGNIEIAANGVVQSAEHVTNALNIVPGGARTVESAAAVSALVIGVPAIVIGSTVYLSRKMAKHGGVITTAATATQNMIRNINEESTTKAIDDKAIAENSKTSEKGVASAVTSAIAAADTPIITTASTTATLVATEKTAAASAVTSITIPVSPTPITITPIVSNTSAVTTGNAIASLIPTSTKKSDGVQIDAKEKKFWKDLKERKLSKDEKAVLQLRVKSFIDIFRAVQNMRKMGSAKLLKLISFVFDKKYKHIVEIWLKELTDFRIKQLLAFFIRHQENQLGDGLPFMLIQNESGANKVKCIQSDINENGEEYIFVDKKERTEKAQTQARARLEEDTDIDQMDITPAEIRALNELDASFAKEFLRKGAVIAYKENSNDKSVVMETRADAKSDAKPTAKPGGNTTHRPSADNSKMDHKHSEKSSQTAIEMSAPANSAVIFSASGNAAASAAVTVTANTSSSPTAAVSADLKEGVKEDGVKTNKEENIKATASSSETSFIPKVLTQYTNYAATYASETMSGWWASANNRFFGSNSSAANASANASATAAKVKAE